MPVISHKAFRAHLKTAAAEKDPAGSGPSPVTLIFGDSHLVRNAVEDLLNTLMPAARRQTQVDTVDAAVEPIADALERVNTYSLLSGPKVVVLANYQMSGSKLEKDRLVKQCSDICRKGDIARAARYFLRLLGLMDIAPADLARDTGGNLMPETGHPEFDQNWRAALCQYCIHHDLRVPKVSAETQLLQSAVEKGFPSGNYLVLTAGAVDKRLQLFKLIQKKGTVVDCAVPQGERHADKKAQEAAVTDVVAAVCAENGKTMTPPAVSLLYDKTGFDLQTVVSSMEKLIAYVGQRPDITAEDVESVLKRTRKEPIYAFTNAIAERNLQDALFLLDELMAAGPGALRPEQVLVAMVNQVRKLLLAKEFVASPHGRQWRPDCSYPQFRQSVLPAVQAFDNELIEQLRQWDAPAKPASKGASPEPGTQRTKIKSDLILAANPHNPYPVYMILKRSENYRHDELTEAYHRLYDIDRRIKTGRDRKRLALEQAVLSICRQA